MQATTHQKQPDPQEFFHKFWAQRYQVPDLPNRDTLNTMLDRTKGRLFFKKRAGFLGSLLCAHKIVWDLTCGTAWCNGTTIGWNPYFFTACSPEGRVFVLGHEVWHTGYDHMGRLMGRDPDTWNQAADHVINLGMLGDGFHMEPSDLGGIEVLRDRRFANMASDEVYNILVQENPPPPPSGGSGAPDNEEGDGGPGQSGNSGSQGNDPFEQAAGDQTRQSGMGTDLRKPEASDIDRMRNVVRATQSEKMSTNPGQLPGEITTMIDKFLNPVLPWTSILRNHLTELSNDDSSWRRPSQRSQDVYLPAKFGDNGLEHGLFATDVSGSISDRDMLRSNSEAKGIYDEFNPERLTLVTFDTEIQNIKDLHAGDSFDSMEITGRGGTDLSNVYEYALIHEPHVMVIFTDLAVNIPPDPGIPVIWIVIGHPNGELVEQYRPPYGKVIMMPPEDT